MAASEVKSRADKQKQKKVEDHPRTNLNGGELVQSTFWFLSLPLLLPSWSPLKIMLEATECKDG